MDADLDHLTRHVRGLARLAGDILGDAHAGEDVAQEAALRAMRSDRRPSDPSETRPWLRTIARRLALNERSARDARQARERSHGGAGTAPSSAEVAARAEVAERLHAAIRSLKPEHAAVLLDRYVGELAPREIARRDGVTAQAIKDRLLRAKAALRARLERDGIGGDGRWQAALAPLAGIAGPRSTPRPAPPPFLAALTGISVMTKAATLAALVLAAVLALALRSGGAPEAGRDGVPATASRTGEAASVAQTPDRRPVGPDGPGRREPDTAQAPVDAARTATLTVRVVGGPERTPVAGAPVHVRTGAAREGERLARTDERGVADFEDLPVGRAAVLTPSRGHRALDLVEGSNSTEVHLDSPFRAHGRVETSSGAPIEGAEIRVEYHESTGLVGASPVSSVTDSEGRFEVPHFPATSSLAVRAEGFARAIGPELYFEALAKDEPLTIVLQPAGESLTVRTVDVDGAPVAGALVQVFDPDVSQRYRVAPATRTDADGIVDLGPLGSGPFQITVTHDDFAIVEREVGADEAASAAHVSVELVEGVTVRGRAVCVGGELPADLVVTSDQRRLIAPVNADGQFRLEHLPPGAVHARVESGTRGIFASFRASGEDGDTLIWDPEIPAETGRVSGRIRHSGDFDPSEWTVRAAWQPRPRQVAVVPEPDGTFSFACPQGIALGGVSLYSVKRQVFVDTVLDVTAGQTGILLDATRTDFRAGVVRGRLTGEGAGGIRAVVACRIAWEGQGSAAHPIDGDWCEVADDGSFEITGLLAGEHRIWRIGARRTSAEFAAVHLSPEEPLLDLGRVAVPPLGRARVTIDLPSGDLSGETVDLVVRNERGTPVIWEEARLADAAEGIELGPLEANHYRLEVQSPALEATPVDFTVAADGRVPVSVTLRARD